jgi:type VI secretion system VgrG family protein
MSEVSAHRAQYTCTIAGQPYDVLCLSVEEEMSRLFQITLGVWSEDPAVDISGWMRKPVVIKVAWASFQKEYHGIAVGCSRSGSGMPGLGGVDRPWGEYTVEVAPTLWLLAQQANCKVFQDKTAKDIIAEVLDTRGMAGKYELKLSQSYPEREYCVQYRETDFAFISRLMEEEGIFYYFTHDGEEKMVVADSSSAYGECCPESEVEYKSDSGELASSQEYLSSITYSENVYAGKVKFKDFNYRLPASPLRVEQLAEKHTDLEIYDYHPERYRDEGRGRELARVRGEAESVYRKTIRGSGSFRSLSSGCKVTISKAYNPDIDGEWLVVSASHNASQQAETGVQYSVSFLGIPAGTTFRAYPETPRPSLTNQTATVVGPKGDKIYMDELGRAKVQFDWDRDGSLDEDSSCWIRVAMPYAGIDEETQAKHGFQWHPLIGDEVVVSFLESDPDRPLITGSVYNANKPPLLKPEDLIENVIRTPYQHVIDLDDAERRIDVETGKHQCFRMGDDDDEHGWIEHETHGEQYVYLWDNDDEWGNLVDLQTSDGHEIEMTKGPDGSRIRLDTENRHWLDLNDAKQWVELATANEHYVNLSDVKDDNCIVIRTAAGHEIWLNDMGDDKRINFLTEGGHWVVLDDTDQRIRIETKKGAHVNLDDELQFIDISCPAPEGTDATDIITIDWEEHQIDVHSTGTVNVEAGQVNVRGGTVNVTADRDLTMKGKKVVIQGETVEVTGSSSVSVSGGKVAVDSSSTLELKGTGEVTIKGALVTSRASGINTLKGALVKIN